VNLHQEKEIFMKKILCLLSALLLMALIAGCGGKKPEQAAAPSPEQRGISRETIDWRGRNVGVSKENMPPWVLAVASGSKRSELPQFFDNRVVFVSEERGKNLNLLQSWANNFSIQAGVSRELRNDVDATFQGGLSGNLDENRVSRMQREIVAALSVTRFSGLRKEAEFWLQERATDRVRKTVVDEYTYFVAFTMDAESFRRQLAEALKKIIPQDQEEASLMQEAAASLQRMRMKWAHGGTTEPAREQSCGYMVVCLRAI
jgi:hypothetical protein